MKFIIKPKYFILFAAIFGATVLAISAYGSSAYELEAKIKAPSMQKLMTESLKIAQESGVPPQKVVVSFMLLSFLGHPNYSYVEPGQNVCAFIYFSPNEGKRKYVFIAKLKDAPVFKRAIDTVGWSMTDYAGWSFLTKHKEDVPSKKEMGELITYAKKATINDLELEFTSNGRPFFYKDNLEDLDKLAANIESSSWSFNISEDKVLMNALLSYKNKKGPELNDWLKGSLSGATIKDVDSNDSGLSKVEVTILRKQLAGFANNFQQQPGSR